MISKKNHTAQAAALRKRAEKVIHKKPQTAMELEVSGDLHAVLHELEVHQVELEVQAQELWIAQAKENSAMEKLIQLYDSAPTGYFTLHFDGRIKEVNQRGSLLLGMDHEQLRQRDFRCFVDQESHPVFTDFFSRMIERPEPATCQISLLNQGHTVLLVEIKGVLSADGEFCHLAVSDITQHHDVRESLKRRVCEVKLLNNLVQTKDQKIKELEHQVQALIDRLGNK